MFTVQAEVNVVEKYVNQGPEKLADAELVALHVFGVDGANQYLSIAQEALDSSEGSLNALFNNDLAAVLKEGEDFSMSSDIEVKVENELSRRRGLELAGANDRCIDPGTTILELNDVHNYFVSRFSRSDIDEVGMIGMNDRNEVVKHNRIRDVFIDSSIERHINAALRFCVKHEVTKLIFYANRRSDVSFVEDGSDTAFTRRLQDEVLRVDAVLFDSIFISNKKLQSHIYNNEIVSIN